MVGTPTTQVIRLVWQHSSYCGLGLLRGFVKPREQGQAKGHMQPHPHSLVPPSPAPIGRGPTPERRILERKRRYARRWQRQLKRGRAAPKPTGSPSHYIPRPRPRRPPRPQRPRRRRPPPQPLPTPPLPNSQRSGHFPPRSLAKAPPPRMHVITDHKLESSSPQFERRLPRRVVILTTPMHTRSSTSSARGPPTPQAAAERPQPTR